MCQNCSKCIHPERPTGLWEGNHAGRAILSRLVLSSEPATLLTTDCFFWMWCLSETFWKPALASWPRLLLELSVPALSNEERTHTHQCVSDRDLFRFKHIPPSMVSARVSGSLRHFRAVEAGWSTCSRGWRWALWWFLPQRLSSWSLFSHQLSCTCTNLLRFVCPARNRNSAEEFIFPYIGSWDRAPPSGSRLLRVALGFCFFTIAKPLMFYRHSRYRPHL